MIKIAYALITSELPNDLYNELLGKLPLSLQEKNARFFRWQDRHANLLGKILLKELLMKLGYDVNCLNNLLYDRNNRPYIHTNIDFNISHSGEYVLCAIADEGLRIGIDIEKIKTVDFNYFQNSMSFKQQEEILTSHNPIKKFFKFWTFKESVIKADGRGLSIPLKNIYFQDNVGCYEDKKWFLRELDIDSNYCACIATNVYCEISDIDLQYKNIGIPLVYL